MDSGTLLAHDFVGLHVSAQQKANQGAASSVVEKRKGNEHKQVENGPGLGSAKTPIADLGGQRKSPALSQKEQPTPGPAITRQSRHGQAVTGEARVDDAPASERETGGANDQQNGVGFS